MRSPVKAQPKMLYASKAAVSSPKKLSGQIRDLKLIDKMATIDHGSPGENVDYAPPAAEKKQGNEGFESEKVLAMRELLRRDNLESYRSEDQALASGNRPIGNTGLLPSIATNAPQSRMVFGQGNTGLGGFGR